MCLFFVGISFGVVASRKVSTGLGFVRACGSTSRVRGEGEGTSGLRAIRGGTGFRFAWGMFGFVGRRLQVNGGLAGRVEASRPV